MISGYQAMCDYGGCNANIDVDAETITAILKSHATDVGFTVVNSSYHQFEPQGVTSVLVLSESHIVIHTWPEKKALNLDVYVCSVINKYKIEDFLMRLDKTFEPNNKMVHWHLREDFTLEEEISTINENIILV